MKALIVIVGLVLAAGAGAAGGALFAPATQPRVVEALQPQAPAGQPAGISPEAQKQLDALGMEISDLQTQLAALRQDSSRTSAAPATMTPAAVASDSPETFAAVHRAAILKVIDDERADQERKAEEERRQRELQQSKMKAERVAAKVPLSEGQKQLLVQFYEDDRTKMEEMRTQMRDAMESGATQPRDAFREAREWHTNELTRLFGTDLGAQIDQADERRPGQGVQNGNRGRRVGGGGAPGVGGAGPGQTTGGGGGGN